MNLNTYMKKINLNESDLLNIVNKVLNEQDERQFDEGEIELLHFIFERELKPPFSKMEVFYGYYKYYNRDYGQIGHLDSRHKKFDLFNPILINIKYKVCQVFQFSYETSDWSYAINPHLRSWLGNQINAEIILLAYK